MGLRQAWVWILIVVWWTASGLVAALQFLQMAELEGLAVTTRHALSINLVSAVLWIPITGALFACVQRFPIERENWFSRMLLHGAAVAAVIVLRAGGVALLNPLVGWYVVVPDAGTLLWTSLWNNFFMSWLIIGVGHALVYARRAAEREQRNIELRSRLDQSRLESLTAQTNPHFLFNTLNTIAELMHDDVDEADKALVALGDLLRASLSNNGGVSTVDREIDLARRYLYIESLRLRDRLRVDWSIDPTLGDIAVPSLILQPLIENAVRYAIAPRRGPGRISISAARPTTERLVIRVQDDGNGPVANEDGHGVGLDNARSRLRCLYGDDASLTFQFRPGIGSLACITIPLPIARETDHADPARAHRR